MGGNRKENLIYIAGTITLPEPTASGYYVLPITVNVGFHPTFNNDCKELLETGWTPLANGNYLIAYLPFISASLWFSWYLLAGTCTWNTSLMCPVSMFYNLFSSKLAILYGAGTMPDPSPLCTPYVKVCTLRVATKLPLNELVSQNRS